MLGPGSLGRTLASHKDVSSLKKERNEPKKTLEIKSLGICQGSYEPDAQSSPNSISSMSSSEKPKWWPISWIRVLRTIAASGSPVSHQ